MFSVCQANSFKLPLGPLDFSSTQSIPRERMQTCSSEMVAAATAKSPGLSPLYLDEESRHESSTACARKAPLPYHLALAYD